MSGLNSMRMLTMAIPEEILVDKAIEALQKYKKELEQKKDASSSVEELKSWLSSEGIYTPKKEEVNRPKAELMVVIMKWEDMGKSVEDITSETREIEEIQRALEDKKYE